MASVKDAKKTVLDWVEENNQWISDFHQLIWNYAEPALREYRSSKAYCDVLRKEGFSVTEGTGGMPTAFMASYGEGRPVIATYAEYDAVPGNSQQAVPYQAPREGLNPWAAGHTDPHSALGVSCLAGILAAKKAMVDCGLKGTFRIYGEPAEKICVSKPFHAAKGYYDGLDAAVVYHPSAVNSVAWDTHAGAYWNVVFTFECIEPETWFRPDEGIGSGRCPAALDAVCLMYTTTKYTKEAMLPHTANWTLNEFMMVGGQCTSDNIPPRLGQISYAFRSPTLAMQQQIYNVLENNAKSVAQITHCRLSSRWVSKTRVGLPNLAISELVYRNLEQVGPPRYGEEAVKVAQEIQKNLGVEPMADPLTTECRILTTPQKYEVNQRRILPPWVPNFGSDDYVEYTWHAPTCRLWTARANLRPAAGLVYPAWTRLALGGIRSTIDPMIFTAAKTIGASMVELLTEPKELEKAWAEFNKRTGGGIGGSKWVAPLLPSDLDPPVDMRWPEYVMTSRGEEWWVPTPLKKSR